jgi:hypothetical protein
MSDRLRKLQEAQARTWEQMKEIRDRTNPDGTIRAEDEEAWTRGNTDLDKLGTQIEEEQRHVATDRVDRSKVPAPRDDDDKRNEPTASVGRPGDPGAVRRHQHAGGYLVPPGWRDEFIVQMKATATCRTSRRSSPPTRAAAAVADDERHVERGPAPRREHADVGDRRGRRHRDPRRVRVLVGPDAGVAAARERRGVRRRCGSQTAHAERIGRGTNQHFTTGTGSSQPQGIVTGATTGVTAAGVAAITADELIDLVHSVDPAYRRSAAGEVHAVRHGAEARSGS